MTCIDDYRRVLAMIATYGDDMSSHHAARVLQKHECLAHFCLEWDQLFMLWDSDEFESCTCEFLDPCCQKRLEEIRGTGASN